MNVVYLNRWLLPMCSACNALLFFVPLTDALLLSGIDVRDQGTRERQRMLAPVWRFDEDRTDLLLPINN